MLDFMPEPDITTDWDFGGLRKYSPCTCRECICMWEDLNCMVRGWTGVDILWKLSSAVLLLLTSGGRVHYSSLWFPFGFVAHFDH